MCNVFAQLNERLEVKKAELKKPEPPRRRYVYVGALRNYLHEAPCQCVLQGSALVRMPWTFHIQGVVLCCSFYDPELGDRLLNRVERRPRASFDFVQQGRFEKQAEAMRLKVGGLALHLRN